jgi:hypothetical protein
MMRNRKKDRQDIKTEALREKNRRLREALKALKEERKEQYIPVGSRVADGYGIDWSSRAREKRERATGDKGVGLLRSALNGLGLMAILLTVVVFAYASIDLYRQHLWGRALREREKVFVTAHYPDVKAVARKSGLLGEWIPVFIPDGAMGINEKHDNATGEGWLSFRFPLEQGRVMAARVYNVRPEKVVLIVVRGAGEKWWPQWLKGRQKNPRISTAREYFGTNRRFRKSGLFEYMAIDWDKCEAYLWREVSE